MSNSDYGATSCGFSGLIFAGSRMDEFDYRNARKVQLKFLVL